ncbi:MAG: tryptophan synthase subunit alpha [Candidatus Nanopelagicaceae bacterium]
MTALEQLFNKPGKKLIGYVPAGFPTIEGAKKIISAMIDGGVDAIEVGFPYSDPIMDGPTIQAAADQALANGTGAKEVFETLEFAAKLAPAVIMSYWNPIEKYGVDRFSQNMSKVAGSGTITPDLTIEESKPWLTACTENSLNTIYVVAPSSNDQRLKQVVENCSGFVYAASLMGVTGARAQVSSAAESLVSRIRKFTELPVCVGLGVSTPDQARDVARYADGVIVGSAFINAVQKAADFESGLLAVKKLATELKAGVTG